MNRFVRAGVLQGLGTVLAGRGCDLDEVLSGVGLSPAFFQEEDNLIPQADFARLLERCVEASSNPHFVLQLCAFQDLDLGGNLGLLMQTASSLGAALEDIQQFVHIQAQFIHWHLEIEGELAVLSVEMDGAVENALQRQLVIEVALAQLYKMLMLLTRRKMTLRNVRFRANKPAGARAFRDYFRAPVDFDCESDCLVLSRADLSAKVLHSNRMLHELVSNQVQHSGLYHDGRELPQRVRGAIRDYLPQNRCSVESVARVLALDVRALQRHLRDQHQTTYQALLDEVRGEMARLYLRETNMSLGQLTYVLGFTDPSTMSRALRQQLGCSPKQWRQRQRAGG